MPRPSLPHAEYIRVQHMSGKTPSAFLHKKPLKNKCWVSRDEMPLETEEVVQAGQLLQRSLRDRKFSSWSSCLGGVKSARGKVDIASRLQRPMIDILLYDNFRLQKVARHSQRHRVAEPGNSSENMMLLRIWPCVECSTRFRQHWIHVSDFEVLETESQPKCHAVYQWN